MVYLKLFLNDEVMTKENEIKIASFEIGNNFSLMCLHRAPILILKIYTKLKL